MEKASPRKCGEAFLPVLRVRKKEHRVRLLLDEPLFDFRFHNAGVKPVHHVALRFRREIAYTFAAHTPFSPDEEFKPDGIVKDLQCKAMRPARGFVLTLNGSRRFFSRGSQYNLSIPD